MLAGAFGYKNVLRTFAHHDKPDGAQEELTGSLRSVVCVTGCLTASNAAFIADVAWGCLCLGPQSSCKRCIEHSLKTCVILQHEAFLLECEQPGKWSPGGLAGLVRPSPLVQITRPTPPVLQVPTVRNINLKYGSLAAFFAHLDADIICMQVRHPAQCSHLQA